MQGTLQIIRLIILTPQTASYSWLQQIALGSQTFLRPTKILASISCISYAEILSVLNINCCFGYGILIYVRSVVKQVFPTYINHSGHLIPASIIAIIYSDGICLTAADTLRHRLDRGHPGLPQLFIPIATPGSFKTLVYSRDTYFLGRNQFNVGKC